MECVGFGLSGNFKTLKWAVLEGPIFILFGIMTTYWMRVCSVQNRVRRVRYKHMRK